MKDVCQEKLLIPVGISLRHVHLSVEHIEGLFGKGYSLTPLRELSQKRQFAANETVTLIGPKGIIQSVRILGPSRECSQVEISHTNGQQLGIQAPIRLSGDVQGTPGITLAGAKGTVKLHEGVITARNHVHMSPRDAFYFKVEHGDMVTLEALNAPQNRFNEVIIRVHEDFSLEFHIDKDEANTVKMTDGDLVRMVGKCD